MTESTPHPLARAAMTTFKERRLELGLSQAELASELGVAQHSLQRWEVGEREPKLGHGLALAKRLGVGDIAALSRAGYRLDEDEMKLLGLLRRMTPSERERLFILVQAMLLRDAERDLLTAVITMGEDDRARLRDIAKTFAGSERRRPPAED